MLRLGIDPGKKGAIVAIRRDYSVALSTPLPFLGKVMDAHAVLQILDDLHHRSTDVFAVLEYAQAMPKQGATSGFNYGVGYGMIQALLIALGIPHEIIRPRAWQTEILRGTSGDTKVRSILTCRRRLPDLDLTPGRTRTPQDGIADAGCMALYAYHLRPAGRTEQLVMVP